MNDMSARRRSLLFIFAHPDDESFGVAGTAARYAGEGVRLTLVTATRDDKGKCGNPPACTP
jgi:LmbE family N-acetylglucosaminyl deacetylase